MPESSISVLPQRIEFRVERVDVLVSPVPNDLGDADAPEHLRALTRAAAQSVVCHQVARGDWLRVHQLGTCGLGRGDNPRRQCHSETPNPRVI